jgi:hypothetical protein
MATKLSYEQYKEEIDNRNYFVLRCSSLMYYGMTIPNKQKNSFPAEYQVDLDPT